MVLTEIILKIRVGNYIEHIPVDIDVKEKTIYFQFAYHLQLKNEIHAMAGARWQPDPSGHGGVWSASNNERNQYAIKYLCGEKSERYYKELKAVFKLGLEGNININDNLFDHQLEALNFIVQRKRCMLAMEMGLGKTLIMLKLMEYASEVEHRYNWWLIAPYGAQKEWERQIPYWKAPVYPSVVTTYESLHKWLERMPRIYCLKE